MAFVSSRNKFPSIGEGDTGPRATRRVGGQDRGGKRVRNWILSLLSPRGLTTGPRSLKSRATRGQIYDDHIFYIPHILNLNLLTQINLYTWILGSSPRMTENTAERVSTRVMTTPPACHPRKLSFSRGQYAGTPTQRGTWPSSRRGISSPS